MSKHDSSGYVSGVVLSRFLQVIEREKKNCILEACVNGKRGRLYIQKGTIINAKTDVLRGEEAALAILRWKIAQVKLIPCEKKIRRDISSTLAQLNANASKHKVDEVKATTDQLKHAIHLAEGNHYKEAYTKISTYLKTYPNDSIAMLWSSRCLGNLRTISETLSKCFRLAPDNLEIVEEIYGNTR